MTAVNHGATVPTMIRLTLTLSDGSTHAAVVAKMPRFWKSWLMQRVPYGADFYGCKFSRELLS